MIELHIERSRIVARLANRDIEGPELVGGEWYHIVAIVDKKQPSLYVNGGEAGQ